MNSDPPAYPGQYPADEADAGREDETSRGGAAAVSALIFVAACAVAGAVVAVIGGWAWGHLADPPSAPLTASGAVYLQEQGLNQQTAVTGWFMVVGLVLGAVSGLVVGFAGRRHGWPTVVAVLVLCAVAAAGSSVLGHHLFSPDVDAEVSHASAGDLIQLNISVGTKVAYLSWLVGGLLGVISAIATWPKDQKPADVPPSSTTLMTHR